MNTYVNYHKHTSDSNVFSKDSAVLLDDYLDRITELGHSCYSTVEHGWQSSYFAVYSAIEDYNKKHGTNIKFRFGVEAYFVKNRFEKDDTNCHLILMAKNEKGRKQLNKALSIANKNGFYKRPRLDWELLKTLDKENIFVTTACVSGIWKYNDYEQQLIKLKEHFGDSLYLEVQYHNTDTQKDLNRTILALSKTYNIPLIAGMDSHYISEDTAWERDELLLSYNIKYDDEEGWYN